MTIIELPFYIVGDKNFRNYFKEKKPNKLENFGALNFTKRELKSIKEIDVANRNIENLYGLYNFSFLETLSCNSNKIYCLTVSKNTFLRVLDCSENYLSVLDVTQNQHLGNLICFSNGITELDLSNNPALNPSNVWADSDVVITWHKDVNLEDYRKELREY